MRPIELLKKTKRKFKQLRALPQQKRLGFLKVGQEEKFEKLASNFEANYNQIKNFDYGRFTTPLWITFNKRLENALLPIPKFSFLSEAIILETMFVTAGGGWLKEEKKFLREHLTDDRLKELLEEDYVGKPLIMDSQYLTSHNGIHHLYHLQLFSKTTQTNLVNMDRVVEWGGGYGNLAKLFRRINNMATYVIIDTPLLSCLQSLYLSIVLGEESVHLITNPESQIIPNKINLLPVCFIDSYKMGAGLFISTWALSESAPYAQDYVAGRNWFNSKHMLIAYQESNPSLPDAGRIESFTRKVGAKIQPIPFLPGNYYAFK